MTVPVVVAFSASCSAKPTAAPRPAESAGSMAALVTGVMGLRSPRPDALAGALANTLNAVVAAMMAAVATAPRDGPPGRLGTIGIDCLISMEAGLDFLGGVIWTIGRGHRRPQGAVHYFREVARRLRLWLGLLRS